MKKAFLKLLIVVAACGLPACLGPAASAAASARVAIEKAKDLEGAGDGSWILWEVRSYRSDRESFGGPIFVGVVLQHNEWDGREFFVGSHHLGFREWANLRVGQFINLACVPLSDDDPTVFTSYLIPVGAKDATSQHLHRSCSPVVQ